MEGSDSQAKLAILNTIASLEKTESHCCSNGRESGALPDALNVLTAGVRGRVSAPASWPLDTDCVLLFSLVLPGDHSLYLPATTLCYHLLVFITGKCG